jgi:hypothetical protein
MHQLRAIFVGLQEVRIQAGALRNIFPRDDFVIAGGNAIESDFPELIAGCVLVEIDSTARCGDEDSDGPGERLSCCTWFSMTGSA